MGLKVVNLKAENFKRIKAIDVTPDGDVVFVGGKNAQGKTSVLDAIWAALAGGEAARAIKKPIRDGESHASVTVDLGEYVVTRKWSKDDAGTLTVTAPSGAKFSSPQALLDDIIGARAFDPLAFTRLPSREQVDALVGLVDIEIDLDAIVARRADLFDNRTTVGRQSKALGEVPELHRNVPTEEVSAREIIDQIQVARDAERDEAEARRALSVAVAEISRVEADLAGWKATAESRQKVVDALPKESADISHLEEKLARVEETNGLVRDNARIRELAAQRDELLAEYKDLTDAIGQLDEKKTSALAAAKFPVEGLSFGDEGVTLNGIPFSQASAAEQLKVSTALAIAANPSLRVLRILDGSLLDSDSLQIISALAAESDYQVWIEVVGEQDGVGVVIEDGRSRVRS